ncbi:hypothetical protein QBC38DRAFT_416718 [Podospora fimiseda]|uniref:Mediator of RNA polymerase II transcription subunit 22 n=1 Tax=Podospora fimiseda TaxID=252190 RepID=A0AAN7BQP2_9PEZI|nr:hypothetical protein QBC38DRAFT_416718 [Podospora fimiseda]
MNKTQDVSTNLLEEHKKKLSDIMTYFYDITTLSTAKVGSTASVGQAAASSMAVETMLNGIIKSVEDLLVFTRGLRQLWAIGPLVTEGEADVRATKQIEEDSKVVFEILDRLRTQRRMELLKDIGDAKISYVVDENEGGDEVRGAVNLRGLPRAVKGRR